MSASPKGIGTQSRLRISESAQHLRRLFPAFIGSVLLFFEPVVCFVLVGFALLGGLITVLLKLEGADSRFPFWTMIVISIGFAAAAVAYQALVRALLRQPPT